MQARVTRITASVGSTMAASGTVSIRTSLARYITVARIDLLRIAGSSRPVLLVGDVLHPVDGLAALLLLDGDVGHGGRGAGPVPVLLAGGEPDHVARPEF